MKDDIGTLKDNIVTLKDEIASHYLSKIALMETHEKARNKAQADAYADMLKMQIQAKESAIPGISPISDSLEDGKLTFLT